VRANRPKRWLATVALALSAGCAGVDPSVLQDLLAKTQLGLDQPLDEATIVAGLKQALEVGTERTVQSTSSRDGYQANPLIRIPLPEELESAASGLRAVGFGKQVDDLELSMNRAAERAAGEATAVFVDAIVKMSFEDARGILTGGENAATQYFETNTRGELGTRFQPIVEESMRQVGLVRLYENVVAQIGALPLVSAPRLDFDDYVTQRALDGLFTVLGQEEVRIREDPAARTTELLQKVFSST